MKNKINLLPILLLLLGFKAKAEGIVFFSGTYEEAISRAKTENKSLFVEFYTDWCGPCKKMDKYVFTDDKVASFYNKNFINLKVNAEKGEGITLAKEFQVKSFPTQLILDRQLNLVRKSVGYKDSEMLIQFGREALDPSTSIDIEVIQKEYEAGNRDPDFVRFYIEQKQLEAGSITDTQEYSKARGQIRQISRDYILSKDASQLLNVGDVAIIKSIYSYTEWGDEIFRLFVDHYDEFAKVVPELEIANAVVNSSVNAAYTLSSQGKKDYKEIIDFIFKSFKRPVELVIKERPDYSLWTIFALDTGFFPDYCDFLFNLAQGKYKKGLAIGERLLKYRMTSLEDEMKKISLIAGTISRYKDFIGKEFFLKLLPELEKAASYNLPLKHMCATRLQLAEVNSVVGRHEVAIALFNRLKEDLEEYEGTDFKKKTFLQIVDRKLKEIEK
ncbi:MAG: thioredoxin fold domain-containing protein [Bacteroidota bacterium]